MGRVRPHRRTHPHWNRGALPGAQLLRRAPIKSTRRAHQQRSQGAGALAHLLKSKMSTARAVEMARRDPSLSRIALSLTWNGGGGTGQGEGEKERGQAWRLL